MKPLIKILLIVCVLAAGGGFYWWKSQPAPKASESADAKAPKGEGKSAKAEGKGAGKRGGGPVSVRTMTVTPQPMPVIIDAVGSAESEHSVAVRPQISGVLEAVLFKEGDYVKAGQSLFRIDPRSAQATVDQTRAAVARDQAQLAQAKEQEARLRPLVAKDYITRNEYDVAATLVKSLEATIAASRAQQEQAQLQLSYAHITAPIAGRTGDLSVRSGNLVTGGTGGTPLVVINSTKPILVSLSVPQRNLDDVRKAWNASQLKVEISANRGGPVVAEGQLVFIDNAVNVQTGTILLKARVKNEHEELWPGQFVAARIILKVESEAIALPESAVQPGQDKPFVYVVRDGKAIMQPVQISRQIGNLIVLSKGLNAGEQVVVDVPYALTDGAAVQVKQPGAPDDDAKGKGKGKAESAKGEGKSDSAPEK
jgi:multidrug efflux system membrane fusion protein